MKTRNREKRLLDVCIDTQMSFVIDNTNPTVADREKYIQALSGTDFTIIGFYFKSSISECIERNSKRMGNEKIPELGIRGTHKKLELPSMSEGFDKLWYTTVITGTDFRMDEWQSEL